MEGPQKRWTYHISHQNNILLGTLAPTWHCSSWKGGSFNETIRSIRVCPKVLGCLQIMIDHPFSHQNVHIWHRIIPHFWASWRRTLKNINYISLYHLLVASWIYYKPHVFHFCSQILIKLPMYHGCLPSCINPHDMTLVPMVSHPWRFCHCWNQNPLALFFPTYSYYENLMKSPLTTLFNSIKSGPKKWMSMPQKHKNEQIQIHWIPFLMPKTTTHPEFQPCLLCQGPCIRARPRYDRRGPHHHLQGLHSEEKRFVNWLV